MGQISDKKCPGCGNHPELIPLGKATKSNPGLWCKVCQRWVKR